MKITISRALVLMMTLALLGRAWCEGEETSEEKAKKEAKFKDDRAAAERRVADTSKMTPEQRADYKETEQHRKDKENKAKNLADYKEKTLNNLNSIKELFNKAEAAFKEKQFRTAGSFYDLIVLATVPGVEMFVETSRNRLVEMEDIAKQMLSDAVDFDLKQDFVKEVELLTTILHDFPKTKTCEVAMRKVINLKSRSEVAGYIELAQAESLEANDKLLDASNLYRSIASNPRYENSVPALKAARKLDDFNKNEGMRAKLKAEINIKADKEARPMLNLAKNYLANNKPQMAIEKLRQVIEKFPDTSYAEQAKNEIEQLKDYVK
ncbi:MAG: hypothetical protein V1899_05705 [Planctomycetota bacterium]